QITPGLAGEYISQLAGSAPTRNQALAALRHFFDALVQRHAVVLNPFASVRGTKYSVTEGKTAELAIEQARKLFLWIEYQLCRWSLGSRRARRPGLYRRPHRRRGQAPLGRLPQPGRPPRAALQGKKRQGQRDSRPPRSRRLAQRIHRRRGHRRGTQGSP